MMIQTWRTSSLDHIPLWDPTFASSGISRGCRHVQFQNGMRHLLVAVEDGPQRVRQKMHQQHLVVTEPLDPSSLNGSACWNGGCICQLVYLEAPYYARCVNSLT